MVKYSLGLDFGTLSVRALLADVGTGEEVFVSECKYRYGVMDDALPDGSRLGTGWALQHPQDYIDGMRTVIDEIVRNTNIDPKDIVGIGVDFTACTVLPVDEDYVPLCVKYPERPHAYVKLWKHHAAQDKADAMTRILKEMGRQDLLDRFGGKISSEYLIPKIWQVLEEDEALYLETYKFIEAADWIVYQLTGEEKRNSCCAGYKGTWSKKEGYLPQKILSAFDERLSNLVQDKLSGRIYSIGNRAGFVTKAAAEMFSLMEGTAVSVGMIDAHAAMPGSGVVREGTMLMIMGTSTCHMLLEKKEKPVAGICGVVEDGMIPGYFGYEAGQACAGDHFSWFVENCVPEAYEREAKTAKMGIHELLSQKAAKQKPGQNGLLALDWWNGNRSVLMDSSLSGVLIGCTLATKPEDIYRALIEGTAYGTRVILKNFEKHNIAVKRIVACGGIAMKNDFLMQIYADVLNREIRVVDSPQAPALGSAIFGAVAAGKDKGGYDAIQDAAKNMGKPCVKLFLPEADNARKYDMLYKEYVTLHDYFGRGENDVLRRLKKLPG